MARQYKYVSKYVSNLKDKPLRWMAPNSDKETEHAFFSWGTPNTKKYDESLCKIPMGGCANWGTGNPKCTECKKLAVTILKEWKEEVRIEKERRKLMKMLDKLSLEDLRIVIWENGIREFRKVK